MAEFAQLPQSAGNRLLDVAIDQFGLHGVEGASTRAIAAAAETTMSAITYHYGGKEGLYLAAARHIADQIGGRMESTIAAATKSCGENTTPRVAIEAILNILDRFGQIMVDDDSAAWARFVTREQMQPTKAFDILYGTFMSPMLDFLSNMLVRIGGSRMDMAEARLRVISIIGQVLVFRVARATLYRAMDWTEVDADNAREIREIIQRHAKAILQDIQRGQTA